MKSLSLLTIILFSFIYSSAQISNNAGGATPFTFTDRISFILMDITHDTLYCGDMQKSNAIKNITILEKSSVKVIVDGKEVETEFRRPFFLTYHGEIQDTMQVIVKVPGFKKETFTYYKKLYYVPTNDAICLFITHEGKNINKIVAVADSIEVNIEGEKKFYSAQELGRKKNNIKENARMLKKIPGFSIDKNGIYINGKIVELIFIDGRQSYENAEGLRLNFELFNELLKLTS